MVPIMLSVVLKAVTGTVPNHASMSQLIINTVIAILLSVPLYLIEAALLLSSHGLIEVKQLLLDIRER